MGQYRLNFDLAGYCKPEKLPWGGVDLAQRLSAGCLYFKPLLIASIAIIETNFLVIVKKTTTLCEISFSVWIVTESLCVKLCLF